MNLPDSPLRLIRAGFFIGLGLALAYLVMMAVVLVMMAFGASLAGMVQWLSRLGRMDGADWALGLVGVAVLLGLTAVLYPALRLRWTMLRNRWH